MNFEKLKETKSQFIIIIAVAIFLRFININSEQLWVDEAGSIYIAKSSLDIFWTKVVNDIHPPLYYVILKGWISIFGYSVASCRSLSALFSILTIPFLYLIGKEIKDEKLGLIIIFLYSIYPFSIYYANEVRSYSLVHLLFTVALLYAIRCIKDPNNRSNYLFLGISGALLIYVHYIGIIYLISIYSGILFFNSIKKIYKNLLISILVVILSYIPWLPYAINDALGGPAGYTGGRLNLINLMYYAFNYFLAPVPSNINDPYVLNLVILTLLINIPLIIITITSIIGFLYSYKREDYIDLKNLVYFIISTLFLLFGISILIGFSIPNTFTAKNLIGGLSAILIIEAFGLYYLFFDKSSSFKNPSQRLLKVFNPKLLNKIIYPVIIILLINSLIINPIFRAVYVQKPDWEGCVKRLKKDFKKHDIVINAYSRQIPDVMRYYSDLHDFDLSDNDYILNYDDDDIEEFFDEISEDDINRIWIVLYWLDLDDSEGKTEDKLIDEYNLTKVDEYEFRYDIILVLYEIP